MTTTTAPLRPATPVTRGPRAEAPAGAATDAVERPAERSKGRSRLAAALRTAGSFRYHVRSL